MILREGYGWHISKFSEAESEYDALRLRQAYGEKIPPTAHHYTQYSNIKRFDQKNPTKAQALS